MSKGSFLLVTFNFEGKAPPTEGINQCFESALNWITYAPNCWILYTTNGMEVWFDRLRKIVDKDASIFIVEVERSKWTGWMPKSAWEWLKKQGQSEDTP